MAITWSEEVMSRYNVPYTAFAIPLPFYLWCTKGAGSLSVMGLQKGFQMAAIYAWDVHTYVKPG